jgi:acyl-CoA synthetase (AMP-forming)/AMP-acid ligase II
VSFQAGPEVATWPAPGTDGQAAQPPNGITTRFATSESSHEEAIDQLRTVKREVTSAISRSHRVRVADVVMVALGSIPATSGKVRRSACVERYLNHEFTRLNVRT